MNVACASNLVVAFPDRMNRNPDTIGIVAHMIDTLES